MKNRFNRVWTKVSRVGLREDEGVVDHREVILLNKLLALLPIVMLCYIPLEIYFNGFSMLYVVGLMIFLFMLPFPLHYYRLFRLSHYYIFLIANIMISGAGLMVGKGINNHVSLIPVVLVGMILFKTKAERVMALLITIGFFAAQQYFFDVITPVVEVTPELRATFSNIFFLMAIVLTFLTGIYFISINREYEKIMVEQKEAIALKNKEITSSITYAQRIQNAILPSDSTIKECLPDSFVFYKPKDIVAGDFYWVEKTRDIILFAAADSTGHGVPGAMVSVVCKNALSRCVREFGLSEPAKILDKAREIVIQEFEKSEDEVNDGMDISLCALDPVKNTLQWSGANNPLLIIRNKEILETKPDKQPVGEYIGKKPFTNHTIPLERGDIIYIFSDGYSDQFGGHGGKKLKYKAFKQLLLANHHKPLPEQKRELDSGIELWKGHHEQVDDMCIIGVKI
jgi:serine phosphatase RsbU (regulator of sigma subunit)